jgi:hypothetical protein
MTLNEFKKLKNPAEYDVKNEIKPLAQLTQQIADTPDFTIEKILLYKELKMFDCDSCPLMNEIYERLWGCKLIRKGKYATGKFQDVLIKANNPLIGKTLERDTMNSFKTTYNQAVLIEAEEIGVDLKKYQSTYGRISIEKLLVDCPEITERLNQNPDLNEFATMTHTIGNFTMLPNPNTDNYKRGFNVGRYSHTNDYWDLSLELMKEELQNDELFNAYIEIFDLRDYIDENGKIIPLFERKKSPEHFEPQTREELTEFLQNANKKIKARGERLVKRLCST